MKGYHKLTLSTNEVVEANVAFKTGSRRLYSILLAGMNPRDKEEKLYTFGYGLGTEIGFAKWLSINPELASQYVYLGTWKHMNLLNKFHPQLNIKFGKHFSIFGGPSFTVYFSEQPSAIAAISSIFFLPAIKVLNWVIQKFADGLDGTQGLTSFNFFSFKNNRGL